MATRVPMSTGQNQLGERVLWTSAPHDRKVGQAVVGLALILALVGVMALAILTVAGSQLELTYKDVTTDIGIALNGGAGTDLTQPHGCTDGTIAVWRHNKFRCKDE